MDFKGKQFEREVILTSIRWYLAYPLSYRQVAEMLAERGIEIDHTSIYRWVVEYSPELEKEFRKHKKPIGKSWRMDESVSQQAA